MGSKIREFLHNRLYPDLEKLEKDKAMYTCKIRD